jgi:hypothetical protein
MLTQEIAYTFRSRIPIACINELPGAVVAPCGSQGTITETGNIIPKRRLTHDQSLLFPPCPSFNARVLEEQLTPVRYGFALSRFIHQIVALRLVLSNTPLLLAEFDRESAYQRLHLSASSAVQSIITTIGFKMTNLLSMHSYDLWWVPWPISLW